jgi:hypothetical protein
MVQDKKHFTYFNENIKSGKWWTVAMLTEFCPQCSFQHQSLRPCPNTNLVSPIYRTIVLKCEADSNAYTNSKILNTLNALFGGKWFYVIVVKRFTLWTLWSLFTEDLIHIKRDDECKCNKSDRKNWFTTFLPRLMCSLRQLLFCSHLLRFGFTLSNIYMQIWLEKLVCEFIKFK